MACAGERVLGAGVIESRGRLPCARRMATLAVMAELAAMLVGMAAQTVGRKAEICVVQIFDHNAGARRGRDVLRLMTIVAAYGSVPAG